MDTRQFPVFSDIIISKSNWHLFIVYHTSSTALRAGRDVKRSSWNSFIGESVNGVATWKRDPQKLKHRLVIRPSNSIPTCITKKTWRTNGMSRQKFLHKCLKQHYSQQFHTHNGNNQNVYQLVEWINKMGVLYNGTLIFNYKERSTDMGYNMDEPWNPLC